MAIGKFLWPQSGYEVTTTDLPYNKYAEKDEDKMDIQLKHIFHVQVENSFKNNKLKVDK